MRTCQVNERQPPVATVCNQELNGEAKLPEQEEQYCRLCKGCAHTPAAALAITCPLRACLVAKGLAADFDPPWRRPAPLGRRWRSTWWPACSTASRCTCLTTRASCASAWWRSSRPRWGAGGNGMREDRRRGGPGLSKASPLLLACRHCRQSSSRHKGPRHRGPLSVRCLMALPPHCRPTSSCWPPATTGPTSRTGRTTCCAG